MDELFFTLSLIEVKCGLIHICNLKQSKAVADNLRVVVEVLLEVLNPLLAQTV